MITLIPENIEYMKGWNIEVLKFPRKYKDQPGVTLGFQILNLEHKPDFKCVLT